MMEFNKENSSKTVAYLSIFTALGAVLDMIPTIPFFYGGVWDSWLFVLSPLFGIILGPYLGALSVGMSSIIGHMVYVRDPIELLFMWGGALCAAAAGWIYQKKWKPIIGIYSILLAGYFIYPVSWSLPLIGIWDILVGYIVTIIFGYLAFTGELDSTRSDSATFLFAAVIGLELDILLRVFILVPGQVWPLLFTLETLQIIWLTAGIITPLKVVIATIATLTLAHSLIPLLQNENIGILGENELLDS